MGIGSLARFFKAEVMTSELEESSRLRYHSLWGRFVTFGITHGDSTVIMPASAETMQAWALELLMLGASPSLEQSAMSAVQSRHQDFGFEAPLRDNQLFCRTMKAVFSLQGSQRTIFPLNKGLLKRMLEAKDLTPAQNRNVVVTVLGTQLCCRVGDLRRFQLCDIFNKNRDPTCSRQY